MNEMEQQQDWASPTLTGLAGQRLETIRATKLKLEVQTKAVACLLDYLGAMISGLSVPWSSALLQYAQFAGTGVKQGTALGLDELVSAEIAAFTNASLAHSIIRDDMHVQAGSHMGVMVVSTALALAQRDAWIGEQLLKGIVGGYEMGAALGTAVRVAGRCNHHFRPSEIVGAFASAAVGFAADDRLDTKMAMNALSLGSNMAAGHNQWPWAGGTEISTHTGTASRSGIASYDLARAGIYSSNKILEFKDGFFNAYGSGADGVAKFQELMLDPHLGQGVMGSCSSLSWGVTSCKRL